VIERSNKSNSHASACLTTIIASDIFSWNIAHSRAWFCPTLRWNPRSPAIELDRQGRSCRRKDSRVGTIYETYDPGSADARRPWRFTSPTSTPTFPPQGKEETTWERETGSGNEWRERERKKGMKKRAKPKERWRGRLKVKGRKSRWMERVALGRTLFPFSFCSSIFLFFFILPNFLIRHLSSSFSYSTFFVLSRSSFRLFYFCPISVVTSLSSARFLYPFLSLPCSPFLVPSL